MPPLWGVFSASLLEKASMKKFLKAFMSDTRGASAVEYGLIAASVAVALIVAVSTFNERPLNNTYMSVAEVGIH
jgi:pilus assembly protein Flp/PilA